MKQEKLAIAAVPVQEWGDVYDREEALKMIREGQCGTFNPALLEQFFQVEGELWKFYETKREAR